MLFKIFLWSVLVGSIVMGYLGIQSGSAGNAVAGIAIILFAAFLLYFLAKLFFNFGIISVKIILIIVLIASVVLLGVKGCQHVFEKISSERTEKTEKIDEVESDNNMISNHETDASFSMENTWKKFRSYFSLSGWSTNSKTIPQTKERNVPTVQKPSIQTIPSVISGIVTEVRSGYFIRVDSHFVKLYGIDAPDLSQTCLDKRNERYECGRKSKMMLERLVLGKTVTCKPAGGDYKGNYIAACSVQDFDVGVGMVSAGWAVADRKATNVYIPYEEDAHRKRLGLWEGKFVSPWEDRAPKRNPQTTKKSKSFWEEWF